MSSIQTNKSDSYAIYLDGAYDVSESLTLRGGVRYSSETKDMTAEGVVHSGIGLLIKPFAKVGAKKTWDNVSWRFVADYKISDDVMLYGSVSTGFKSGGFTGSASTAVRASTPFEPERATAYEIGVKSMLFDNRVRLNVSAFKTDYKNLQVTRFFQPAGSGFGEFITENAGVADIKGLEIELTAMIIEGFEIGGSYAYLNAIYTKFAGTPNAGGTGNFSGKILRQAPENSFNFYGKYSYDLSNGSRVAAKISYRHQSISYYDPDNNDLATIPAYGILDARLSWTSEDDKWDVALWMKNMQNTEYRTHVFTQRGGRIAFALFGAPKTIGATVTFNF
jgi:iron complex outermembrane receptor protein